MPIINIALRNANFLNLKGWLLCQKIRTIVTTITITRTIKTIRKTTRTLTTTRKIIKTKTSEFFINIKGTGQKPVPLIYYLRVAVTISFWES